MNRHDGTLDEINSIWTGNDESKMVIDRTGLTGENGVIRVYACNMFQPMTYMNDAGELDG